MEQIIAGCLISACLYQTAIQAEGLLEEGAKRNNLSWSSNMAAVEKPTGETSETEIAARFSSGRRVGNISPYRKEMLTRIAQHWNSTEAGDVIVLTLEIGKRGNMIQCQILQSSGNTRLDKEAITGIQSTDFEPLPDWYGGPSIVFVVELQ